MNDDLPEPPEHSLPTYAEPTPETPARISREEEAELALKGTRFAPGTAWGLIVLLLATLASVPLVQMLAGGWAALPPLSPRPAALRAFETALEEGSVISRRLRPAAQTLLTEVLGTGSEQVYLGRDGWLFYRPDVDYVTGPGFDVEPPVRAIVHFRDQLAARGIDLIVVPVPVKAAVAPRMLSAQAPGSLENPAFPRFLARLEAEGVRFFRPKAGPYLATDTHWEPETMQRAAADLARVTNLPGSEARTTLEPLRVEGEGDLQAMLGLPPGRRERKGVTIQQVVSGTALWRPSPDAEVLLLGDSFANIYSLAGLGWGEGAGFAEHLSHALGRPVDAILRNSDGAFATREMLARELARGHDRLAGKKLVVWEFAERELAFGDWKLLDLRLGERPPPTMLTLAPGGEKVVTARVAEVSPVPRPGSVPYPDHIMAAHVTDLPGEAVVYLWSMRGNEWTPAARLRPGDTIRLRLRPWAEVSDEFGKFNRSELDDPDLQLEEPVWGELAE